MSKAIQLGIFFSEILKRERHSSRRIEKFPTPGQRFSDKLPTAGTCKMTIARQMSGVDLGTLGID